MTFFLILIVLIFIIYMISYNNRDISQDYKINPKIGYRNLVGEDKMRLDMTVRLENQIKNYSNSSLQGSKEQINLIIETYRQNCLNNIIGVASDYKISIHLATSIVNEMCDGAFVVYILGR